MWPDLKEGRWFERNYLRSLASKSLRFPRRYCGNVLLLPQLHAAGVISGVDARGFGERTRVFVAAA
jgi:hypothetical protein